MSKVAVVFWSATGNTETMANCVADIVSWIMISLWKMHIFI